MNTSSSPVEYARSGSPALTLLQNGITHLSHVFLAGSYLTFFLGEQLCGIRLNRVRYVLAAAKILPLSHAPALVRGVMLVDKHYVPVLDLQQGLDPASTHVPSNPYVILARIDRAGRPDQDIGLVVDGNPVLSHFAPDDVCDTPAVSSPGLAGFCMGGAHKDGRCVAFLAVSEMAPLSLIATLREKIAALGRPGGRFWQFGHDCWSANGHAGQTT
jgi:chemotaxis signal transduction protein